MPTPNIDFKLIFESVPGLYLILEPDFKIVAVSDSYLKATLTEREKIIGRGLFDVFPDNPDDPTADGVSNLRASLNTVLKSKAAHTMSIQKYDIRNYDGTFEERHWSPVNKPVLNDKKEVIYIIHRVEDVTDFVFMKRESDKKDKITESLRERVQEMEIEVYKRASEIKISNLQLESANKELEAFSYTISHDLRAPLRAINNFAQILKEDYTEQLDTEANNAINTITQNANKMNSLIDELLAFSKLGRKELLMKNIDTQQLVKEVIGEINKLITHKATIKIGTLHKVKADYNLLFQVLFNLISNAIKYSSKRSKPIVEIYSEEKNDEVIFFVKDNGAGFDMRYVDKLFGVFQRLHTEEEFEGVGVGLAIIKRIIDKHGGKVWAEGKLDHGATFHFSLSHN